MNIRNLLIIISFLLSAPIHSQVAVIDYLIEKSTPQNETFTQILLKDFKGKKRIILHDSTSTKAPTHTLETDIFYSEYSNVNDPIFVDSTQTIKVWRKYGVTLLAYIGLNNIETSEIEIVKWINGSIPYQDERIYKYADFKYKKGSLRTMKQNAKKAFFKKIKDKAINEAKNKVKGEVNSSINKLASSSLIEIRSAFPYQLKVTSDESSSKGKTVLVDGGIDHDLTKDRKLIFYAKNKIESEGKTFYRLIEVV